MSRVVVTGGAGFLGSWVCERLLDTGHDVVCVDNFCTGERENAAALADRGAEVLEQDVSQELTVAGRVDQVLHLASPASPRHYLERPVDTLQVGSRGTTHALELAEAHGARFLFASTSEVYGDPQVHPQSESYWGHVNPIGPRSVYDEAKRFGEAVTMAFRKERGVDTAIVRIFNTYGPRMRVDDGRAIPAFMSQAIRGEPITVAGDGSQTRSLCYVEDTVEGIVALADSTEAGPINIGGPTEITVLELANTIRERAGSASPIEFFDLPVDDPRVRRPDISLAAEVLDWRPRVGVEEGLARTLDWFTARLSATPA